MNPTFKEQLKQWQKIHMLKPIKNKPHQKASKTCTEILSESDIKSLMGMNKPTMRRGKGGAWRNG